jgi:hypothetical protein
MYVQIVARPRPQTQPVLESAKVALFYDWFFYRGPNQITCIGMYARALPGSWRAVRCGELNANSHFPEPAATLMQANTEKHGSRLRHVHDGPSCTAALSYPAGV